MDSRLFMAVPPLKCFDAIPDCSDPQLLASLQKRLPHSPRLSASGNHGPIRLGAVISHYAIQERSEKFFLLLEYFSRFSVLALRRVAPGPSLEPIADATFNQPKGYRSSCNTRPTETRLKQNRKRELQQYESPFECSFLRIAHIRLLGNVRPTSAGERRSTVRSAHRANANCVAAQKQCAYFSCHLSRTRWRKVARQPAFSQRNPFNREPEP